MNDFIKYLFVTGQLDNDMDKNNYAKKKRKQKHDIKKIIDNKNEENKNKLKNK